MHILFTYIYIYTHTRWHGLNTILQSKWSADKTNPLSLICISEILINVSFKTVLDS